MAMRKVTRTQLEEEDDDMVRETVHVICKAQKSVFSGLKWLIIKMNSLLIFHSQKYNSSKSKASIRIFRIMLKKLLVKLSKTTVDQMINQTWDIFADSDCLLIKGCNVNTDSVPLPQQVAHSTCGDSEYNLRSRTVVCGSCGLPSDKSSSCSVSSASRSFRSGGLSEGLLPHSYVFSTSTPRKVGTDIWPPLNLFKGLIRNKQNIKTQNC